MSESERLAKLRRKYDRLFMSGSKKDRKEVEKAIISLVKEIRDTAKNRLRGA